MPRILSLAAMVAVWAVAAALAHSRLLPGPLTVGAARRPTALEGVYLGALLTFACWFALSGIWGTASAAIDESVRVLVYVAGAAVALTVVRRATVPALLAGGSLCLLLTVNEFGVVLFIGAKGVITLPLMVYDKAIQEFDYPAACVVAIVNVVLSLGLYSIYRVLLSQFGGRRAGLV